MKKILSISLALLILFMATPFSELNLNVQATEPIRTQQEAKNWIISAEGEYWDWDSEWGAQCVDLIYYYYNHLGVAPRGGNANAYIYDDSKVPYELGWEKIQCYDGFLAQSGDIALFDYGKYGHIGLIIDGDVYGFTTLENNREDDSGTSVAMSGVRGYSDLNFWGVIRPKFKPSCASHSFNASSVCTKCGFSYDYQSTRVKFQATAKATEKVYVRKSPYEVGDLVDTYSSGTQFTITGKVVNGYGNEWYVVLSDEGSVCVERYVVATKLTIISHTCEKGEFEYFWADHPHYNSYKCKVCGKSIVDYNSSNFSPDCNQCSGDNISTGTYAIKNNATGTYMCVSYGADVNKQNVDLYSEINSASKMVISKASTGYKIRPECCASRLINPYGDIVTSGLNVNIYDDMNDSSQWWQFQKVSGGYIIRNVQNPNCVLDTEGGNVFVNSYTGATTQVWSLVSTQTHTHSYGAWKLRKAATCTATGVEYRVCSCGNEETRTIAAYGHSYSSWTTVTSATCTSTGTQKRTCTGCGATQTQSIPKESHSLYNTIGDGGYIKSACYNCSYSVTESSPSISYSISNGEVTIEDCATSIGGDIIIPSILDGYPVTEIGEEVFLFANITSVEIPNSVRIIAPRSFEHCSSLIRVNIPNSLTTVGYAAFHGCYSLTYVYYSGNREQAANMEIESYNPYLNSATWCYEGGEGFSEPNASYYTYTVEGGEAIINDVDLSLSGDVIIPTTLGGYPVTKIDEGAFSDCKLIERIKISNRIEEIHRYAFANCTSLNTIIIPFGVKIIGEYAFEYCENLVDVYYMGIYMDYSGIQIHDNNLELSNANLHCNWNENGFPEIEIPLDPHPYYTYEVNDGNATITDVDLSLSGDIIIPTTLSGYPVIEIADNAFYECDSITSVIIPDTIKIIGDYAFACCDSLASVTIPDSVVVINAHPFYYCDSLTSIEVSENNEIFASVDGALFDKTKTTLISCPAGIKGGYIIPDGVTTIDILAFCGCHYLTSVTIPNSVTHIEYGCLYDCISVTDIYYTGTKEQAENITIEDGNDYLTDATWHYIQKQDLNGDGQINLLDLVKLKKILAGYEDGYLTSPDLDKDGDVGAIDLIILMEFILADSKK